jgi:hypothetical protein
MVSDRLITLISYLAEIDEVMSRTARGVIDTSARQHKRPLLMDGDLLDAQMRINRENAARMILWTANRAKLTADDLAGMLLGMHNCVCFNLLSEGTFRAWPYPAVGGSNSIEPDSILKSILDYSRDWFPVLYMTEAKDKGVMVAQIEWDIGIGPLHPFYDGCGRTSRYFACLVARKVGLPFRRTHSREEYFSAALEGRKEFVEYYLGLPEVLVC